MRQSARLKEILEREIVTGEYRTGDRLEELEIANRFGVSRTPVREALMMLEAIGLLERRPNQGVVVKGITLKRLIHMLEALVELEAINAKLAARRAKPSDLEELEIALEEFNQCVATEGDVDAIYNANIRFHRAIYNAAGNEELTRLTEEIGERMEPFIRTQHHTVGWVDKAVEDHRIIVKAIRRGDQQLARETMLNHIHVDMEILAQFAADLTA